MWSSSNYFLNINLWNLILMNFLFKTFTSWQIMKLHVYLFELLMKSDVKNNLIILLKNHILLCILQFQFKH